MQKVDYLDADGTTPCQTTITYDEAFLAVTNRTFSNGNEQQAASPYALTKMAFRLVKPGAYRVGRESIASVGLSVFRHALDGRTRRLTSVYPCLDFFEGWAVSPAARASHGNVDLDRQAMGRTGNVFASASSSYLMLPKQTREGPQFIATGLITPRDATGFKQDTAFRRDYYALKSHFASRLALPNPQSRHRQDYYAVKSHFAAARRIVEGCGNTCAAVWLGDTARRGTL